MTVTSASEIDVVLGELTEWLEANWDPSSAARLVAWGSRDGPRPTGPGSGTGGLMRADALRGVGCGPTVWRRPRPGRPATGMAGPTLLVHGTDDQKRRHLRGWSPAAMAIANCSASPTPGPTSPGSRRSLLDGDDWVVNGQKVWTSGGQVANKAMLVARTNVDVPKHAGISYFLIRMDQPGIEVRPLVEMTGRRFFNEVFITDARPPQTSSAVTAGWTVANTMLAFERVPVRGWGDTTARPGLIAGDPDRPAGGAAGPGADATSVASRPGDSQRLAAPPARRTHLRPSPSARAWPGCTRWNGCSSATSRRARACRDRIGWGAARAAEPRQDGRTMRSAWGAT